MSSSRPRMKVQRVRVSHRRKNLRFDTLEERRVLAALEVFVFGDVDGSRDFASHSDTPVFDRPVFVDLNHDGQLNGSEPWTTTDLDGIARFQNLEPGEYTIRLLGENQRVLRSTPVAPANSGVWTEGVGSVIRVETDGSVWSTAGNLLLKFNRELAQNEKSFAFEGDIQSVVFDTSTPTTSAFVIAKNNIGQKALWQIPDLRSNVTHQTQIDVSGTSHLIMLGGELLVQNNASLRRVSFGNNGNVINSAFIDGLSLNASSVSKSYGPNGLAVLNTSAGVSEMVTYNLTGSTSVVTGRRFFASDVLAWEPSPDGSIIAVSTKDDFLVVQNGTGLVTQSILADAVAPIVFDAERDLLLTGNRFKSNELIGWKADNWTKQFALPISNGELYGTNVNLRIDAFGRFLVGSINGRAYQHDLADAVLVNAVVMNSGTTQVQIGIQFLGQNQAPTLSTPPEQNTQEDVSLRWSSSVFGNASSDTDSDKLVYVVRSQPTFGSVSLSSDGNATYIPNSNANGRDSFVVQAYDGWAWSETRTITINVAAVDDQPSDITASLSVLEENVSLQSPIANIQVQDPDSDTNYQFQVADTRFEIIEGILKLITGAINFEKESTIVLPILAINRLRPTETISRTLTFSVSDQNDAPTGVSIPNILNVPELISGFSVGQVEVIDEDANSSYVWQVSDPRFEIADGQLKVRSGVVLDFETEPSISMTLKANDSTSSFFVERSITLNVSDLDDAPTGIRISGTGEISEQQPNAVVGTVSVLDADQNERYSFQINDNRFQVSRGVISLRPGVVIVDSGAGYLDLIVTATSNLTGLQISNSSRLNILRDITPYHNDIDPYDVDGDSRVSPLDPLIIINFINTNGTGPLRPVGEGEGSPLPNIDVDGDGSVSPIDILILINRLNREAEEEEAEGDDSDDGMPDAEGEFVSNDSLLSKQAKPDTNQAVPMIVQPQPSFATPQATDISLADYLDNLDREVGPRRLRRR